MSPRRFDLLVGAIGASVGAVTALVWSDDPGSAVTAAIMGGMLAGARRRPRATWLAAVIVFAATALEGTLVLVPEGGSTFAAYLLAGAHLFATGRFDSGWSAIAGLVALMGVMEAVQALAHDPQGLSLFFAGAFAAGRVLREREEVAGKLAERARELEEEREAHARLSVRYERARIASELHDIVAHAISVMVVQASAGQRLAARDPELTKETFEAIADQAHQAQQDIGRLVALLGDEDAIGPAPDLTLVEELVTRASGSGLAVTLRLEGEREGLPAPLVETTYRIVQEGLTNALRYASGAPVTVLVRGEPQTLTVEVINAPAPSETTLAGAGTGNGLRGLRERVGALGGTLDAGPTTDGGWRLAARLGRRVSAPAT